MKIRANRKYTTIAFYATAVIAVNVLLVVAVLKFSTIMKIISSLVSAISPVIWGLAIAFLMNPLMVNFEKFVRKRIYKKEGGGKLLRACSVSFASIVFLGVLAGLLWIVIPELINSIKEIFGNWGELTDKVQSWIDKLFKNYPKAASTVTKKFKELSTDFDTIYENAKPMLEDILSGAWDFITVIKDFIIGFIISIYLLCSKEKFLAQAKKIVISTTKKSTCEKIMHLASRINTVFSGFLVGKIIDSIIIGFICFICLTIMNMPYNIMISVIIGVTNVIPFFGPIIGAVPSTLLMLIISPQKAIILLIFIIILQQFDGNILGPKILGDSTGLPGFWVLVSILFFGSLWNFIGMLIAVPTFALIYSFVREAVEARLKKKKLPVDTAYYMEDVEHLYKKPERRKPLTAEDLEKMVIPSADEVNEVNLEYEELDTDDGPEQKALQKEQEAEKK